MIRSVALFLCVLFLSLSTARSVLADESNLRQAYQREFAFLEAERSNLKSRLAKLKEENEKKLADGQAEVDALQGQVLGLAAEADQMSESLLSAERDAEGADDGSDQLESTLQQMIVALEKGGRKLPEAKKEKEAFESDRLKSGFEQGLALLREFSQVKSEKGKFFAPDGRELSGTLVKIGQIASYGITDSVAGALAPAGDGRLKLWNQTPSTDSARGVLSGAAPDRLRIFLYETLDKGVEEKKDKTVVEVIEDGGVIGWVIVAIGLIAVLMAILRAFFLMRSVSNTGQLVEAIAPLVRKHQYKEAIEICDRQKSAAGRVLKATLKHINRPREELEDIISESILHETPQVDRFGSSIMVIAAVAPLLGLLGTVTGMIATFDIITEFGTGNPKLLSSGISVALVTTELGLIVAIPALMVGNLLSAWAESIKDEMDRSALHITNISAGVRLSMIPRPGSEPSEAPLGVLREFTAAPLEGTK